MTDPKDELIANIPTDIMAIGEAWAAKLPDTPTATVVALALMIDREQLIASVIRAIEEMGLEFKDTSFFMSAGTADKEV